MQRSVRENIALPFSSRIRRWGIINGTKERRTVGRGHRAPPDRHARAARGPAPVGRQPAEGDHRALGGRRRPHDAVLRPDPRASTSAPRTRSTTCSATSRRPARASSSTPQSSTRSASRATGRSSSSAARWSPRSPRRRPTTRRSCARRTTSDRVPPPPSSVTLPWASRRSEGSPMTATARRRRRERARRPCAGFSSGTGWTLGPDRLPDRAPRLHEADPAVVRGERHPGPCHRGPAPGTRRGRAGGGRHRRRHRPVDRLDDGAHQRRGGHTHGRAVARGQHRRRGARPRHRPGDRRGERRAGRPHPRAGHRRHPGDGLRVGRRRAPRPAHAGGRIGRVAAGPRPGAVPHANGSRGRRSCWP